MFCELMRYEIVLLDKREMHVDAMLTEKRPIIEATDM